MADFCANDDIEVIKELLGLSAAELAEAIGVSAETVSRWCSLEQEISAGNLAELYDFAFRKGIRLNKIDILPPPN